MIRTNRNATLFALLLAFAVAACDDDKDPVSPDPITMEDVAGDYIAEGETGVLKATDDDDTTDWLAEGGKITLELTKDGDAAGQLVLPGAGEGGADLEADLEGTWELKGDTVRLSPTADSFLKELPLIFKDGKLEGKKEISGIEYEVVLVREDS